MNALDKKARRKCNRQMRQQGVNPASLNLGRSQKLAEMKFNKLSTLNNAIDTGDTNTRIAAAKAKRQMNVDWQDRGTQDNRKKVTAMGTEDTFRPMVLDVKKRYLRTV